MRRGVTVPSTVDDAADECLAVRFVIRNDVSELSAIRPAVDTFLASAKCSEWASYVVHLTLEELITNVIKYARSDSNEQSITVHVQVAGNAIRVVVEDEGQPFDPTSHPEPVSEPDLDTVASGGLGIHLVRQLADRMTYRRAGDRNRVEVHVRLDAVPPKRRG